MKNRLILLLLSSLVFANTAFAETRGFDGEKPTAGYYKTKMICGSTQVNRYMQIGNIWATSFREAGVIPLVKDVVTKREFNQLKIDSEFEGVISDPQHFKAIEECFGDDRRQRDLFFFGLLAADISAKFSAWVLDISMVRSLYYGSRAVIAASAAEMPQRYMWFRVVVDLASKNRTVLQKVSNPVIFSALISSLVAQRYANNRVRQEMALSDLERNDPTLKMLVRDLDHLKAVAEKATDEQKEVLLVLIDDQLAAIEKVRASYASTI